MNFVSAFIKYTGTRDDIRRKVHAIPIGINYGKFNNFRKSSAMRKEQRMSKVFSIDRLDYTKGLVKRIGAIEALIRKYPEYREKFTFIMIVTPSRANIRGYDELKNDLEMNVGRINGLYGNISWMPITYMYRKLTQTQLMNYYYNADVALITPLKDGLNLVAEEFVATTEKGALVISEFAGVADYLPHAIKVNPNSIEDISEKLKIALDMPEEEKLKRLNAMKEFVIKHDDRWWAKKVLGTVNL
jgi:trehalose 6-phosphate synthase